MSPTLTSAPAAAQTRRPGRGDRPSAAIDPPESAAGADGSPDAVALMWDLDRAIASP